MKASERTIAVGGFHESLPSSSCHRTIARSLAQSARVECRINSDQSRRHRCRGGIVESAAAPPPLHRRIILVETSRISFPQSDCPRPSGSRRSEACDRSLIHVPIRIIVGHSTAAPSMENRGVKTTQVCNRVAIPTSEEGEVNDRLRNRTSGWAPFVYWVWRDSGVCAAVRLRRLHSVFCRRRSLPSFHYFRSCGGRRRTCGRR